MMFLEFFIWGAWFVTLGTFLGNNLKASGLEISNVFSTQSWGAIIAPFIIGMIADRYFNAERILGVLHIAGAFLMYQLYQSDSIGSFFPYVLGYMILYANPVIGQFRIIQTDEKSGEGIFIYSNLGNHWLDRSWFIHQLLI